MYVFYVYSVLVILHNIKTLFPEKADKNWWFLLLLLLVFFIQQGTLVQQFNIRILYVICTTHTLYIFRSLFTYMDGFTLQIVRACVLCMWTTFSQTYAYYIHVVYGYAHIIIGRFTYYKGVCVSVCKFSIIGL